MPITAEQRKERQRYLCASDMPVILGMSPYTKTPGDIYFSKVYDLPADDAEGAAHLMTGNLLEGPLLDWAAAELGGVELDRQPWCVCDEGPAAGIFAAHPDAIILPDRREGIEAKYANAAMGQAYGEDGTDSIPDHVVVQAQHQMLCGRLQRIWVPAAIAGFSLEFRLFSVPRDEALISEIVTAGMAWWERHVIARVPPEGEEVPPLALLKRIRREPQSMADLTADPDIERLVFEYQQAGLRMKEDDDARKELQARILHLLGEHEGALLPDGRVITYLAQKSAPRCDFTLLRADHPEVYERYVTQGQHRVMRVKEPKKGKGE